MTRSSSPGSIMTPTWRRGSTWPVTAACRSGWPTCTPTPPWISATWNVSSARRPGWWRSPGHRTRWARSWTPARCAASRTSRALWPGSMPSSTRHTSRSTCGRSTPISCSARPTSSAGRTWASLSAAVSCSNPGSPIRLGRPRLSRPDGASRPGPCRMSCWADCSPPSPTWRAWATPPTSSRRNGSLVTGCSRGYRAAPGCTACRRWLTGYLRSCSTFLGFQAKR